MCTGWWFFLGLVYINIGIIYTIYTQRTLGYLWYYDSQGISIEISKFHYFLFPSLIFTNSVPKWDPAALRFDLLSPLYWIFFVILIWGIQFAWQIICTPITLTYIIAKRKSIKANEVYA